VAERRITHRPRGLLHEPPDVTRRNQLVRPREVPHGQLGLPQDPLGGQAVVLQTLRDLNELACSRERDAVHLPPLVDASRRIRAKCHEKRRES
jgi:hypothetical protein